MTCPRLHSKGAGEGLGEFRPVGHQRPAPSTTPRGAHLSPHVHLVRVMTPETPYLSSREAFSSLASLASGLQTQDIARP